RGDGFPGPQARARGDGRRPLHARGPGHARAVTPRARGAERQAVRLPGRRAARGAPHPGRDDAARARRPDGRRARPPRPSGDRAQAWTREDAVRELVRGRLEAVGPTTAGARAASLGLGVSDVDLGLAALEREGFVLRGRFTPGVSELEWCERRLLARIHRYTL